MVNIYYQAGFMAKKLQTITFYWVGIILSAAKANLLEGLTPRKLDVFRLLLEGYTLQETADKLRVKHSTVNTHMSAIYKTLNIAFHAEILCSKILWVKGGATKWSERRFLQE